MAQPVPKSRLPAMCLRCGRTGVQATRSPVSSVLARTARSTRKPMNVVATAEPKSRKR